MGAQVVTSTQDTAGSIIDALIRSLPAYSEAVNKQKLPTAQADLGVAQAVSPAYAQLMAELYAKYAPELAKAGAGADTISRIAGAQTDLGILRGPGAEALRTSEGLNREINPEFYASRKAASDKLGQLLGSIDLNAPNAEAERLVGQEAARTGNINTPSQTGTVANALSFGNELQKRRNALGQAISLATQFLPATQSTGFNPLPGMMSKGATNTGTSEFTGVVNPSGQAASLGAGLLGSMSQSALQEAQNKFNQKTTIDKLMQLNEPITNAAGSI